MSKKKIKKMKRKAGIFSSEDKLKESYERLHREAELEALKQHFTKLKENLSSLSTDEIIDEFFDLWLLEKDDSAFSEIEIEDVSVEELREGTRELLEETLEGIEKEKREIFLAEGRHQLGRWHIAFQKPLSSFDLTDEKEFKKAVHYTNLCPRWSEDIDN